MPRAMFRKGGRIERIERNLDDPHKALRQIGVLMVAESQKAFKEQQFGDRSWDARRTPNVFGILADFAAGRKAPPARRFDARPALRDTGRLGGSIAFQVLGDAVEVGTALGYAAPHQFGGEVESVPITESVQKALGSWLKRQNKGLKRSLGWLMNPRLRDRKLRQRVPARRFVGITDQTRASIGLAIGVEVFEAGR